MAEEGIGRDHTHKHDILTTAQRVYMTLRPDGPADLTQKQLQSWMNRTTVFLGFLVDELQKCGTLTQEQIDEMLVETVPPG